MKITTASYYYSYYLLICLGAAVVGLTANANTNLTFHAGLSTTVGYDNNVFLQDKDPDLAAVPKAALPFQDSIVLSLTPKVALDYRPSSAFNVMLSYAPEMVAYTSESSENHISHRAALNLGGKLGEAPWQFGNSLAYVQGSRENLYFGGPGGAPAIGGIPIRNRREQFVYHGNLNVTWTFGKWFFRPVAKAYWHDFRSEQRADPGYENYIDRRELGLGGDFGYEVMDYTRLYAGFRFGYEIQGHMPYSPYYFNAEYYRPVFGAEGQPWKWIKVNFCIGPDIHHTIGEVPSTFNPNYTTVWVDGTVTFLPTSKDSISLIWKENTQPAFASCSVYDDIVYQITGRHNFDDHWSAGAGFKVYIGDWYAPAKRYDWIYTPSAQIGYVHDKHLSAELAYSYDWTESKIPDTEGRNFTRHLVWLSVQYRF